MMTVMMSEQIGSAMKRRESELSMIISPEMITATELSASPITCRNTACTFMFLICNAESADTCTDEQTTIGETTKREEEDQDGE